MAEAVYILCALTSLACAGLLARAYRKGPSRLLLWSGVCFMALAVSSVLVMVDLLVLPQYDLRVLRWSISLLGLVALVWALINERDEGGPA